MECVEDNNGYADEYNKLMEEMNTTYDEYKNLENESATVKKAEYVYPLLDLLDNDLTHIQNIPCNIHICAYQVNLEGAKPFYNIIC